ncbi:MAG: hypothetical protein ACLQPD_07315 [Desulfomonilaceae bacterium]
MPGRKPFVKSGNRQTAWSCYLGIALLAVASLWPNLQMIINCDWIAVTKGINEKDEISSFMRRFDGIKKTLPERALLGYFSDVAPEGTPEYGKAFFLTQYSLAPIIVADSPDRDLVIGDVKNPGESSLYKERGFTLEKDFGDGVVLFKKGTR